MSDIQIIEDENSEETVIVTVSGNAPSPIIISTNESSAPVLAVNGKLGFVILNKNDIGLSNVEDVSIIGSSGILQSQINGLSGQLIASGNNLNSLINNLSGYVYNSNLNITNNLFDTGKYLSDLTLSLSGSLNSTGSYLLYQINDIKNWTGNSTGLYYPLYDNPASYITGVDLSNYVTKNDTGIFATNSNLYSTGNYLISQISFLSGALNLTGLNLQLQINNINNISGNFVTNNQTGVFALKTDLVNSGVILSNSTTSLSGSLNQSGAYLLGQISSLNTLLNNTGLYLDGKINSNSGYFQNLFNNLDLNYATDLQLQQTGNSLYTQIMGVSGLLSNYYLNSNPSGFATVAQLNASGINLQDQIFNIYNSGFITGFNSGDYVLKSETGVFALNSNLIQSGNNLSIKIDNLSGYSNNTFSTVVNLVATGSNLDGKIISLSGSLINSGNYLYGQITGASELLQNQIYNTGLNLNNKITSFSGDFLNSGVLLDGKIYSLSGDLLSTGQLLWNNILSLSGDLLSSGSLLYDRDVSVSGSLNATGISLYNQIEQAKILAIAYAIAL